MLFVFVALSVIAVRIAGINGVALSWFIVQILGVSIIVGVINKRLAKISSFLYFKTIASPLLFSFVIVGIVRFLFGALSANIFNLFAAIGLCFCVYGIMIYMLVLNDEEKIRLAHIYSMVETKIKLVCKRT